MSEPATPAYPKVPKLQLHRLPLAGNAETPAPLRAGVPKLALESLATTPIGGQHAILLYSMLFTMLSQLQSYPATGLLDCIFKPSSRAEMQQA